MSAYANIIQLARAHYEQDESAFASAASVLSRGAKISSFRDELDRIIREGRAKADIRRRQSSREQYPAARSRQDQQLQQLPPKPVNNMLRLLDGPAFADLLLPADTQAVFDEIVTELEFRSELAERGLRPRDRILLHGPPGNGKTSSAVAIAKQLSVPCYGVDISQVVGKYLGETGRNMQALFESIPSRGVTVLDEIDAIGSSRSAFGTGAADKELNNSVNVLLTTLDRSTTGIIIATTNRPDILDSALKRRFEEVIEVPAPTSQQKRALSERLCAGFGVPTVDVEECENFDAVTKACKREARRVVMIEILAADTAEEE
jgi:SpoVK/Ycf46/Vps4 family AAA+-type ATPase